MNKAWKCLLIFVLAIYLSLMLDDTKVTGGKVKKLIITSFSLLANSMWMKKGIS